MNGNWLLWKLLTRSNRSTQLSKLKAKISSVTYSAPIWQDNCRLHQLHKLKIICFGGLEDGYFCYFQPTSAKYSKHVIKDKSKGFGMGKVILKFQR